MPLSYDDLIEPAIVRQVSKSVAYCRCTRSKNLPFCDGSHAVTNIQPFVLELEQPETIAICRCWKSKDHPYCDGTHGRLVKPKERPPRKAWLRSRTKKQTDSKYFKPLERPERLNQF